MTGGRQRPRLFDWADAAGPLRLGERAREKARQNGSSIVYIVKGIVGIVEEWPAQGRIAVVTRRGEPSSPRTSRWGMWRMSTCGTA